jgi:hypothetical protein
VFQKPAVVIDYTFGMRCVNRADHCCPSYRFLKKSLKCWRKLYFWILEISLVNSFHLYNMNQQSLNLPTLSDLEIHNKVIEGLVGNIWNRMFLKHMTGSNKGLFTLLQQKSERRQEKNVILL